MLISAAGDIRRLGSVESVTQREVEIEPIGKLECVPLPNFCYLGDILGAGGVEKAARARMRCACSSNVNMKNCKGIIIKY